MSDPGGVLPFEIVERVGTLGAVMRVRQHVGDADELASIFEACERAFANEFDRGYEHAQGIAGEWHDPPD